MILFNPWTVIQIGQGVFNWINPTFIEWGWGNTCEILIPNFIQGFFGVGPDDEGYYEQLFNFCSDDIDGDVFLNLN